MTYTLDELNKMMEDNGGTLYLSNTQITSLPDGLTVGGSLYLSNTQITNPENYRRPQDGEYVPGRYFYCDEILTHVKKDHKIGDYTFYVGKIDGINVIYDGENYAHCKSFSDGVADLSFKKAKDRGADQYKSLTIDSVVTAEEAITMYRIITGACKAGTLHFIDGLKEIKESYTVKELIEITNGQYGSGVFKRFFTKD